MKRNWFKTIIACALVAMIGVGTNTFVFAREPEIPSIIQPRLSETKSATINAAFTTSNSVKVSLNVRARSTSTYISGTLTLSGSDGSEYNWNVSGTGSASFNRTISGCTADEYTLTFTGYCGSEYIDIESVATR